MGASSCHCCGANDSAKSQVDILDSPVASVAVECVEGDMLASGTIMRYTTMRTSESRAGPTSQTTSAAGQIKKKQHLTLRQFEGYDCVRVFFEDKPGARVVAEIPNETKMHVLEYRGDFIHVRSLDEAVEGWIGCKNVVKTQEEMDERRQLSSDFKRKERLPQEVGAASQIPCGHISDIRRQELQAGATAAEMDTTMALPESCRAFTESMGVKQPFSAEEVELDDGARYIGQWSDNQINGYGVLKKPDGSKYEGYLVNGRKHGHGVLFENNENTYEGEWLDGLKHGYGKYVHLKVSIYEGEWHHDQRSGEGTEEWADGAKYAGEYLQGCKHGLGTYWSGTGNFYKGQFQCDKMHGYGTYTFADKRTYVGQFENGHMNGVGAMRWQSGATYTGSYKGDEKNGEGTFMWADGRKYAGQWQSGKFHGHGIMTTADGVSTAGEWNAGSRVSRGIGISRSPIRCSISTRLDCDVAGQALRKGSHVIVHGRSAAIRSTPDSEGCCAVTFDVDDSVSKNLKCNELTKVPFTTGNHVVYDGCNGVIIFGPDEDGKFRVKSHIDGKTSYFCESQLTWATLQPKHLLPPDRVTHGAATRVLYHKTARGDEIRLSGKMLRGRGGAVGGGIYFAGSLADCNRKAKSRGWIVKAKVLLGRHMIVKMSSDPPSYNFWQLYNAGFDSIELRGFASGTEYVVFSKDQVQILEVFKERET